MADINDTLAANAPAEDTSAVESTENTGAGAGEGSAEGNPPSNPLAESLAALRQNGTTLAEVNGDEESGAGEAEGGEAAGEGEAAGDSEAAAGEGDAGGEAAGDGDAAGAAAAAADDPPRRLWMKSLPPRERAQLLAVTDFLRSNPGKSLAEAAADLGFALPPGTPGGEGTAAAGKDGQQTASTEAQATAAPDLAALRAEIAALDAEAQKAAEVDFDPGKARKIDKQIVEKTRQLEKAEAAAQAAVTAREQGAVTEYQAQLTASTERSYSAYPEAHTEGTALHAAVEAEVARLNRVSPAVFEDPEWVESVVAKIATRQGVMPVQGAKNGTAAAPATGKLPVAANGAKPSTNGKPAPTAPKPPAKPAARAATPVSGTAGAAPTPAGLKPLPDTATLSERMARLREIGTKAHELETADA